MTDMLRLIDWAMVGRNVLWIVGLAVMLAAYGFRRAERSPSPTSWVDPARRRAGQVGQGVRAGLVLFTLGLLATSTGDVERLVWAAVTGAAIVEPPIVYLWRRARATTASSTRIARMNELHK